MRARWTIIAFVSLAFVISSCTRPAAAPSLNNSSGTPASDPAVTTAPVVTFIELGSVECIPCKAMQPVMESIRNKYPDQVSVIFYDVWTKEGQPYSEKYRIRVIPTQVFLDQDGREYYRHEGFFPEEELIKILAKGGVKL